MIVIPAIDLKDGKCVRLMQGDFSRVTVYSDQPVTVAEKWRDAGAERIHIVDLDGSLAGSPKNLTVISEIIRRAHVPVQVGGGIRNLQTIGRFLDMGVSRVILGTAALKDRRFVLEACDIYKGKIILGIDAKEGRVAVEGWTEETAASAVDIAESYKGYGIDAIVYTDIKRDGMQAGVNLSATKELAESAGIPVIASGGVSGIKDIENLAAIEKYGIIGVIIGKALYAGSLSLEEAIKAAGGKKRG
ncbi:MAG: 1-(5-phosphoribosyl)-5-[(5-phosphoribosylamino)methylideneamino]imidazole-4-carboxamide isomerase [Syntrophales bacterium]